MIERQYIEDRLSQGEVRTTRFLCTSNIYSGTLMAARMTFGLRYVHLGKIHVESHSSNHQL